MSGAAEMSDVVGLTAWLSEGFATRVEALRKEIVGCSKEAFAERRGLWQQALHDAWDAAPEVAFEALDGWRRARSVAQRVVLAGAVPLITPGSRAESLDWMRELSRDRRREVRLLAIERLCGLADEVIEEIKRFARDKDVKVREVVARQLRELREPAAAVEELRELCLDRSAEVHWAATESLGILRERDDSLIKEVAQPMAASEDVDIRWAVAIGVLEPLFAESLERQRNLLRSWLRSGERNLRWTIAHSLRFVSPSPRFGLLAAALCEDKDPVVRRRILWQIEQLAGRLVASDLVPLVERARDDTSRRVREQAEATWRALHERRGAGDDEETEEDDEDDEDDD